MKIFRSYMLTLFHIHLHSLIFTGDFPYFPMLDTQNGRTSAAKLLESSQICGGLPLCLALGALGGLGALGALARSVAHHSLGCSELARGWGKGCGWLFSAHGSHGEVVLWVGGLVKQMFIPKDQKALGSQSTISSSLLESLSQKERDKSTVQRCVWNTLE